MQLASFTILPLALVLFTHLPLFILSLSTQCRPRKQRSGNGSFFFHSFFWKVCVASLIPTYVALSYAHLHMHMHRLPFRSCDCVCVWCSRLISAAFSPLLFMPCSSAAIGYDWRVTICWINTYYILVELYLYVSVCLLYKYKYKHNNIMFIMFIIIIYYFNIPMCILLYYFIINIILLDTWETLTSPYTQSISVLPSII